MIKGLLSEGQLAQFSEAPEITVYFNFGLPERLLSDAARVMV